MFMVSDVAVVVVVVVWTGSALGFRLVLLTYQYRTVIDSLGNSSPPSSPLMPLCVLGQWKRMGCSLYQSSSTAWRRTRWLETC